MRGTPFSIAALACVAGAILLACAPVSAPSPGVDKGAPAPAVGAVEGLRGLAAGGETLRMSAASDAPAGAPEQSQLDRMIVRTTSMNLNVSNVSQAVESITEAVTRRGGYVASANFKNDADRGTATLSVRVPSREVDDFIREMRRSAVKVNEESTATQDVTEEYTDLGSQLRNLEATEQRYLELLTRANSVDDILKVQNQLNQVRGQIERIKGRLQNLERRTEFSQVNLTLVPEIPVRTSGGWDPGRIARQAWEASLAMLERVAEVGITVVVFSWWLVPVGGLAYLVALLVRRRPQPEPGRAVGG